MTANGAADSLPGMTGQQAFVLFGDVVRSRTDARAATSWLRRITAELETAYAPDDRLAPFAFTQGDELQGLLSLKADPVGLVLRTALHPDAVEMRWAVVAGVIEPGSGPATERTGPAFLTARSRIEQARARRDRLVIAVGTPEADALLDELAPLLGDLIAELTDRQREIARLMLVDGLRQSEVAERLAVSRATISVMADRARIRRVHGLAEVLRRIVRDGTAGTIPVAAATGETAP